MRNLLNNICVFAASCSGDSLMGDVPVGKHILLSSKSFVFRFRLHTNYNSQGTSRLFSYFSNLSACQKYLQNCFRPIYHMPLVYHGCAFCFFLSFWRMRHGRACCMLFYGKSVKPCLFFMAEIYKQRKEVPAK